METPRKRRKKIIEDPQPSEDPVEDEKTESALQSDETPKEPKSLLKKKTKSKKPKPILQQVKSRKSATKIINEYHTFTKQLEQIKRDEQETGQSEELASKRKEIEKKMNQNGGIHTYQEASTFDYQFRKYSTDKWIVETMKQAEMVPEGKKKLKVLDVGSLANNFKKYPWMEVKAIDINPQDPSVEKMDFFDLDLDRFDGAFEVVILSLVINFVGDPLQRGRMLLHCNRLLQKNGHLFIVTPLACLNNSRYLNEEIFMEVMISLGFEKITSKNSKKLAFFSFRKMESVTSMQRSFHKDIVRPGSQRNNFCIVLLKDKETQ
eukprot:TRINITY_DN2314_c0_g2_i1.p1 TRINITY_DN2314_c0_g2~~TRINITY_DN2314_c0_g2_i1.p1  ORF type:complete len:320 (-),score=75.22 TRINITY_DN2314_c0_g2_i1:157-1116(-)